MLTVTMYALRVLGAQNARGNPTVAYEALLRYDSLLLATMGLDGCCTGGRSIGSEPEREPCPSPLRTGSVFAFRPDLEEERLGEERLGEERLEEERLGRLGERLGRLQDAPSSPSSCVCAPLLSFMARRGALRPWLFLRWGSPLWRPVRRKKWIS